MQTQVSGSAQSTRSTERTKRCIRITTWATRILAPLSSVFCIVAFVTVGDTVLGIFMMVTAILSVMSLWNLNCCCYLDCSRNTQTENMIAHCSVYVWMFMSNMGYFIMLGYSCFFYRSNYSYSNRYYSIALLDTIFAFTLIITFMLSMLNLYSFRLVYKYGCCFMDKVDRYHSEQVVETAVVMKQNISTIGGVLPVNGLQFTNATVREQKPFTNPGAQ